MWLGRPLGGHKGAMGKYSVHHGSSHPRIVQEEYPITSTTATTTPFHNLPWPRKEHILTRQIDEVTTLLFRLSYDGLQTCLPKIPLTTKDILAAEVR